MNQDAHLVMGTEGNRVQVRKKFEEPHMMVQGKILPSRCIQSWKVRINQPCEKKRAIYMTPTQWNGCTYGCKGSPWFQLAPDVKPIRDQIFTQDTKMIMSWRHQVMLYQMLMMLSIPSDLWAKYNHTICIVLKPITSHGTQGHRIAAMVYRVRDWWVNDALRVREGGVTSMTDLEVTNPSLEQFKGLKPRIHAGKWLDHASTEKCSTTKASQGKHDFFIFVFIGLYYFEMYESFD